MPDSLDPGTLSSAAKHDERILDGIVQAEREAAERPPASVDDLAEVPGSVAQRPSPDSLWARARREHHPDDNSRRKRYHALLREHGHLPTVDSTGEDGAAARVCPLCGCPLVVNGQTEGVILTRYGADYHAGCYLNSLDAENGGLPPGFAPAQCPICGGHARRDETGQMTCRETGAPCGD